MAFALPPSLPCSRPCSSRARRRARRPEAHWSGGQNGSGHGGAHVEQQEQQQARPSLTPWDDQPPTPRGQLLVMTQRGIPSVRQEVPDSPCPACGGSGKVTCGNCRGKGRLNYPTSAMLPHGAWPEWCPSCRASGRWHCERCMGTGVRRDPIGFRLPHEDSD